MPDSEPLVMVAKIVSPFGRFGEVKALLETDYPEGLAERKELFVTKDLSAGGKPKSVESVRFHKGAALIKFEGIDSIDDAETLRGLIVAIPEESRPDLANGSFWMSDIIGLEVVREDGVSLGRITEVTRTKANDIWVTPFAMIPAVKDIVLSVDFNKKQVLVKNIEGLET